MNVEKWDAIADSFDRGDLIPANGWYAWQLRAAEEAILIRSILWGQDTILEVGCGVGRLTPFLAFQFLRVQAMDTSPRCREVTAKRCARYRTVTVIAPGEDLLCHAAVVWGNLYDEDWSLQEAADHFSELKARHRRVLVQTMRADINDLIAEPTVRGADWFLLGP